MKTFSLIAILFFSIYGSNLYAKFDPDSCSKEELVKKYKELKKIAKKYVSKTEVLIKRLSDATSAFSELMGLYRESDSKVKTLLGANKELAASLIKANNKIIELKDSLVKDIDKKVYNVKYNGSILRFNYGPKEITFNKPWYGSLFEVQPVLSWDMVDMDMRLTCQLSIRTFRWLRIGINPFVMLEPNNNNNVIGGVELFIAFKFGINL